MIRTGIVCREFIGRTIELEFLIQRVLRVREGHGSALLVKGSAGIGKSRLVREVLDVARRERIRCADTACAEFGDVPYAPVIAIAEALGAAELAELFQSAGSPAGAGSERGRRFAAAAAAFAAVAEREPFVAVIEDLHWAPPASLELIRHLVAALREHPVAFVFTERGDDPSSDALAQRNREAIEREADAVLTLESLTNEQIKLLIASVLREDGRRIPTLAVDEVSTLSDGRPFHAEELLRGMLERTSLQPAPANPEVPRSLRTAVVERLSVLDERERIVLAHSAVIGTRFEIGLLADLVGLSEGELLPILRKARNAQLVVEDDESNVFAFRHALTREVVYGEILRAEARVLHARIAQILIERDAEAVLVAYHAWRSGDAALTHEWNARCGDNAANTHAHIDAIRHFERAYASAPAASERSALAERIAQAHYSIGEITTAADWFKAAAEHAGAGTDRALRLSLDRARSVFEAGDYDGGIALANDVVDALEGVDSAVRFEAETRTAALLNTAGRTDEAYARLEAATTLRSAPEPRWAARHRGIFAHALHYLGRVEESAEAYREAEAASRAIGDNELLERTLNNAAHLQAACGDTAGAVDTFRVALSVAREMNSGPYIGWVQQNIAYALTLLGRFPEAREAYAEAVSIDHGVPSVNRWLAAIAMRIGTITGDAALVRPSEVEAALEEALASGDDLSAAVTAGAAILERQARGDSGDALAARYLAGTRRSYEPWIVEAAGKLRPDLAIAIRTRIAEAAAPAYALGMRATLALLDARLALRERRREDADEAAQQAAAAFKTLGWPLEEAYARELRGGLRIAVDIFRRIGADAEAIRRTTVDDRAPRRRGETTLTTREREIAGRIAAGQTNREVAESLVISERTVETHVASIYGKLGVNNRKGLAALLNPPN